MCMKSLSTCLLALLFLAGLNSCSGKGVKTGEGEGRTEATADVNAAGTIKGMTETFSSQDSSMNSAKQLEVYYFRFSRSCTNCEAIESETKSYLKEQYPEALQTGAVSFTVVNLEKKEGRLLAEQMEVDGQTLLLCGKKGKRIDLTAKGFCYAATQPNTFKKALEESITSLITASPETASPK